MAKDKDLNLVGESTQDQRNDYLQLLDQFPFRPTLYIGLGGTGSQAVAKIKALFLGLVSPQAKARMKADAPEIDQLYAFASFDTNTGERPKYLDAQREWFHLGVRDLRGFYEGVGRQPQFADWVVRDFPNASITAGASGFRNLGRLALLFNISEVRNVIAEKYSQIMTAAARPTTVNSTPIVYICCSLSGGTGSGMILDLCFLIREILGPAAEVIGLIAILDGLPSLASIKRQTMLINTYSALKELNAFMTRTTEGIKFGERVEYPFDVAGKIEEPFTECYLISPYRQDGSKNLSTQGHVTSFIARYAFMMSAFSFSPDKVASTPDWAGVMVNQKDQLARSANGAKLCYITPGLAQTHFPVNDIANIIVLEAAERYLRYQSGGTATEGEDEARAFVNAEKLKYTTLRDRIGLDPLNKKGAPLAPVRYDDEIKSRLESPERYEQANEILAYAKKLPAARMAEIDRRLQPNVEKMFKEIWGLFYGKVRELLEVPAYLGFGALDFADDLIRILKGEIDALTNEGTKGVDEDLKQISRDWAELEAEITDVVTNSGFIDRFLDKFRIGKAAMQYASFLNEAEEVVLAKAKNELTARLYKLLIDDLQNLSTNLSRLIRTDLPTAIQRVNQRSRKLHTELRHATEGTDPSVENVCSVSVMDQEWIDAYTKEHGLTADTVLSNLLKKDWHPISLIAEVPPDGVDIATHLGQVVIDQIEPLAQSVRESTPINILRQTGKMRGHTPEATVARLFYNLQPQMQLSSMRTHLGTAAHGVVVSGGLDAELIEMLRSSDALAGQDNLTPARNQEAHRLNFFSATLPIALAGCDLIRSQFEPAYNRWMEEISQKNKKEQEYELRLYHCFPRSHQWPSPTRYANVLERQKTLFACALALSEMLPVSDADRKRMNQVKKMQELGYALFQYGRGAYWIWPFFEPDASNVGGRAQGRVVVKGPFKGVPQNIGSNVLEAYEELERRVDLQREAQGWVNWFAMNWVGSFNAGEVDELKQKAVDSFNERKGRTTVPKQVALWDDLIAAVEQWQFEVVK